MHNDEVRLINFNCFQGLCIQFDYGSRTIVQLVNLVDHVANMHPSEVSWRDGLHLQVKLYDG